MMKTERNARRQAGCAAAWLLALMCCVQPWAHAEESTPTKRSDCGCVSPYRTYPPSLTATQQALFAAAQRADANTFMRLLPLSGSLGDVGVNDQPILAAIIAPDPALYLDTHKDERTKPEDRQRLAHTHRTTLRARLRMLRAALAQGAHPNDVTNSYRHPALHLAIAYGSPDMVDALLKHGADPKQTDLSDHLTPLEFLLDHAFFLRLRGMPEMLTRDERAQIVTRLMKAGSPEPRRVNWTELVTLVSGDHWLNHLLSLRNPSPQDLKDSETNALPSAAAAYFGDTKAMGALLARIPRFEPDRYRPEKNPPFDLWLDTAIAAIHGDHAELARSLLRRDMNWAQRGPRGGPRLGRYAQLDIEQIENVDTALDAAIYRGNAALAKQLLDWGSPIGGSLIVAVQRRDPALIRMLVARGADPVTSPEFRYDGSPLTLAIKYAPELVPSLLAHPTEATRQALNKDAHQLLGAALKPSQTGTIHSQRPVVEALLKAGLSAPSLSPVFLHWATRSGDAGAVEALHAGGAPWPQDALADAIGTGQIGFIERVSQLSGQTLASSCPRTYDSLIRLVREAPPFADRLLDLGLRTGACGDHGPLSHRLLEAWGAPESRPLMGTRRQRAAALLQRLWQLDPAQRTLPQSILAALIARHRPDLLSLALDADSTSPQSLGGLAQQAIAQRNPEALRLMRTHGLTGDTLLPDGKPLAWHLGCERPAAWRPLAGFSDLPAPDCPAKAVRKPTATEEKLAQRAPGTYYLSGAREVGSELTLTADGHYTQATSYGAIDQFMRGSWHVEGDELVLQSEDSLPVPPFRILKAWHQPDIQGVEIRATEGGRLLRGLVAMPIGSETSYIGQLRPRGDEGWTRFDGDSAAMGRLEGLAMAIAHEDALRWGLMPVTPDEQGRLPNRIEVDVNRSGLTPPSHESRLRFDKGDLISSDDSFRGRFERTSQD